MDKKTYHVMYQYSIENPDSFWAEQAEKYLNWDKAWEKVIDGGLENYHVRWFRGAKLNASYNCLDRHLPNKASQLAIIWEGDDPRNCRTITYQELYVEVCRFANAEKFKCQT